MTVRLTDETDRIVPTSYLDAGHLDHGYAMTIHKAQGLAADEALSSPPTTCTKRRATQP